MVALGDTLSTYIASLLLLQNWASELVAVVVVFTGVFIVTYGAERILLSWVRTFSQKTNSTVDDALYTFVSGMHPAGSFMLTLFLTKEVFSDLSVLGIVVRGALVLWVIYQSVRATGILIEDVIFERFSKEKDLTTRSALKLVANLTKGVVLSLGLLYLLASFGVNVTSLLAGAGIAGIAIAFALQGILTDLFSSFSIYFDKPFGVGDFIAVGEVMGTVRHIGIKSTRIQSLSGEEITISNQDLTKAQIKNFTRMSERRVVLRFGTLYSTPIEKCRAVPQIVRDIIAAQPDIRFDRVHLYGFGESSLDFEAVYFILSGDYVRFMDLQQEINLQIIEQFRQEGIVFAYPTRTIHTVSDAQH
jgi:small-conductance mechanosensitive channel